MKRSFSPLRTAALLALVFFGFSQSTQAQARWLQTAQVLTPIQDGDITQVLLDSLASRLPQEAMALKQSPEEEKTLTYAELEERLLDEGLDLTSANQVFISYRFSADQQGLRTEITELYFIYRPEYGDDVDIPVLALNAQDPIIQRLLTTGGVQLANNQANIKPFRDELAFHQLRDGTLASLGNRVLRDEAEASDAKRELLTTMRRFLYN